MAIRNWLIRQCWRLPHDQRRDLFRLVYPVRFQELQHIRRIGDNENRSFKPLDTHRCIFVHNPKTAGVSINNSLFDGRLVGNHVSISKYQLVFTKREFNSYFKFAFVRNPWDRLYSAYRFLSMGGFNAWDQAWAQENLTAFPDFLSFVKGWVTRENVSTWQHFKPQHEYLADPTGRIPLDFIGRFERLDTDFKKIAAKLGKSATLPHLNRTGEKSMSHSDYRDNYDDEAIQIAAQAYSRDIELFGYHF